MDWQSRMLQGRSRSGSGCGECLGPRLSICNL
jgi:hypothetical protein